jgi:gamma-glutamyltranspeptidase/glutathione hydrolase
MKDGRPVYATGTPGGDLIISTITQIIVNLLDFNMSLQDAVFSPRIFSTYYQPEMELENRFPKPATDFLSTLGHELKFHTDYKAYFGAVQSIMYDEENDQLIGVSDPRRSGGAIGE